MAESDDNVAGIVSPDLKTWADIERASLHCPILQQVVHVVRAGIVTSEQALIAAALWLSEDRQKTQRQRAHELSLQPASGLPPCPDCGSRLVTVYGARVCTQVECGYSAA